MSEQRPDIEIGPAIAMLIVLAVVLVLALAGVASASAPRHVPVVRDCGHDETCAVDGPCVWRR